MNKPGQTEGLPVETSYFRLVSPHFGYFEDNIGHFVEHFTTIRDAFGPFADSFECKRYHIVKVYHISTSTRIGLTVYVSEKLGNAFNSGFSIEKRLGGLVCKKTEKKCSLCLSQRR
ncbi:hypothetical protein ACFPES_02395 [Paenibacillus sp. GCM10023248]|uniref:hypothetical protein n=1 Tax=Bacillus sp. 3255 TaxID=2817904 RepID=UPI00286B6549|nr:hypothetical protein [Bacillus sp. 3255]MDD9265874.1 hypothetical protein [Paenibacillus sp. MAHUQ-63]